MKKGKYRNKRGQFTTKGKFLREQHESEGNKICDKHESSAGGAKNDISWYSKNPNLLVAAGSFAYPYRPGMTLPLGGRNVVVDDTGGVFYANGNMTIPGVMALDWVPTLGYSATSTDPASVLAKEVYAKVRQVYSGSLDVDAPDFTIYLMALDSIFAYIASLKRIYRLLTAWSPENYSTPDVLLTSMYIDQQTATELRAHRTELWQIINELVLQSRKFMAPASMDIFNRHYWMSDNVYTDDNTINSQFYVFNLNAVYKYTELKTPQDVPAAGLTMQYTPLRGNITNPVTGGITVQTLYEFGLDLINALVAWDDAYIINGYLKRAFDGEAMFIVDELRSDETLIPVYEPEVLMQIENSHAVGVSTVGAFTGMRVTQDPTTNAVLCNCSITMNKSYDYMREYECGGWELKPTLSIRSQTPTVADSVIASRLKAAVISATLTGNNWTINVSCGTELPLFWHLHYLPAAERIQGPVLRQSVFFQCPTINYSNLATGNEATASTVSAIANMFSATQFDWAPMAVVTTIVNTGTAGVFQVNTSIYGDTHNITVITKDELQNLHRICRYSEFNSFGIF
nr:capsid protein [Rat picobirnavirus]